MCGHRWRVNGAKNKRQKKEWQDSREFWLNFDRCCWYGNRVASLGDAALHICFVYFPRADFRPNAQRQSTTSTITHMTSRSEGTHAQDDRDENKYERNILLISRLGNPEIISPSSPVSGTRDVWDPRDRMALGPGPNILGHMVSWDTWEARPDDSFQAHGVPARRQVFVRTCVPSAREGSSWSDASLIPGPVAVRGKGTRRRSTQKDSWHDSVTDLDWFPRLA